MYPQAASQVSIAFGLMELDSSGKVIRYCSEGCESIAATRESVIGKDFFNEVVPTGPGIGLKTQFDSFIAPGPNTFEKIERRYELAGQKVRVQLLFSRNVARSSAKNGFLVLARVTPEA